MFGINTKCTPFQETHPTTSSLFLETFISKSRNTHSSYSTSKITSSVVVKFSKYHEGQIFASAANKYNHNDRRFKTRLWGLCRQAFHQGHMEFQLLSAVLQPIRNIPVGQHPYINRLLKKGFQYQTSYYQNFTRIRSTVSP